MIVRNFRFIFLMQLFHPRVVGDMNGTFYVFTFSTVMILMVKICIHRG